MGVMASLLLRQLAVVDVDNDVRGEYVAVPRTPSFFDDDDGAKAWTVVVVVVVNNRMAR